MASSLFDCTALLRRTFRQLAGAACGAAAAALGLVPLLFAGGTFNGRLLLIVLLLSAFLARKILLFSRARLVMKQLRLEEQFLRYPFAPDQFRQCLQRADHLWSHSFVLQGLREVVTRPLPLLLPAGEKHRRLAQQYHRSFRRLRMPAVNADLLLLLLTVCVWIWANPLGGLPLAAWPARLGLLAAPFALLAEMFQIVLCRRTVRLFARFEQLLGAWTLAEPLEPLLQQSRPYNHTLLYQAPPWFVR